jgi:hypothetical protein
MSRVFDPAIHHQVVVGFTQTLATALANTLRNQQTVTVADPTVTMMRRGNPAETTQQARLEKLVEQTARAQIIRNQSDPARGIASVSSRLERQGRANDKAQPKRIDVRARAPQSLVSKEDSRKKTAPKTPSLASTAARAVRVRARKNEPAARQYFVKQMIMLNREEVRLALADKEVRNSLREYVIGAIDDRGKRRDQAQSPRDWLIFNDKKQRMVFKQLGLAKR